MDGLLTLDDVMEITRLSRTKIYEMIQRGEFPKQRRISHRCARWSKAEVNAWLNEVLAS